MLEMHQAKIKVVVSLRSPRKTKRRVSVSHPRRRKAKRCLPGIAGHLRSPRSPTSLRSARSPARGMGMVSTQKPATAQGERGTHQHAYHVLATRNGRLDTWIKHVSREQGQARQIGLLPRRRGGPFRPHRMSPGDELVGKVLLGALGCVHPLAHAVDVVRMQDRDARGTGRRHRGHTRCCPEARQWWEGRRRGRRGRRPPICAAWCWSARRPPGCGSPRAHITALRTLPLCRRHARGVHRHRKLDACAAASPPRAGA